MKGERKETSKGGKNCKLAKEKNRRVRESPTQQAQANPRMKH